jgi:SEC-C motif domain protein
MRSRFTAFALDLADYVLESWHPSTRPRKLELEPDIQWYRLDILGSTAGGLLDREGTVEFDAYFRHGDTRGTQHEVSQFRKEAGRWFYVGELV